MDVIEWLSSLGLERYAPAFEQNHISPELLPRVTADDLKELGIAIVREQGSILLLPSLEAALAEAEASAGETDAGLRRLDDALAELERTEHRCYEAEIHRIRGEMLLKRDPTDAAAAQQSLQAAIGIAQSQKARGFELRAAVSCEALSCGQSRRRRARGAGAGRRGLPADPTTPRTRRGANPSRR